jgi:hypothetical protein
VNILSTVRSGYAWGSGTSMAAPHVSGAAALALAACSLSTAELKSTLLENVDPVSALAGRTTTGGRLDVGSALIGCTSAPPAPDFTVSASPLTRSVSPGASGSYGITAAAVNGFASAVTFSVSGLPSGATATFSPETVTGSGSSAMTVAVAGSTAPGTYALSVTAQSGTIAHAVGVTLVVAAAPDFSIAAAPASVSVKRGKTATYTVTVTGQNEFNASVGLTVSGLPAGATATFSPASVTGSGTSTLNVVTGTKTPRGTFALTISGAGGGLTRTATVKLKVS